jgi:hypothetical protein
MLVKFVSCLLITEHKEHHLPVVSHFLDRGEADENFFMNIIACGETWLYCYDLETEQISTNIFITMTQDIVPSLMQDRSDSFSFFIQEVVIHHECAAQNQIVHQQFYLELLGWLYDLFCYK